MAATPTLLELHDLPWLRDEPPEDPSGLLLQKINVAYEYPVHFTHDVFSWENLTLVRAITRCEPRRRHRLLVVVDRAVAEAHPCLLDDIARYVQVHRERLVLVRAPLVIEGGERAKGVIDLPAQLHAVFDQHSLDRHSFVVIIGGGALQDVVGFAAATAHRGLRVIRLPTTVLAQGDGAVGVKNGVNAFGKKNFLGTFAPPFAVIDDFDFLQTLPPREAIAGMAEAVKVALIRDAGFFEWIRAHSADLHACVPNAVAQLVRRTATHHLEHIAIAGDPFETGSARPLDFGHWAAHRLEIMTEHELRHGEAVAIGCALDAVYSAACGLLDVRALEPIVSTLEALGLPTYHPALDRDGVDRRRLVLDGLQEFREHLGGELTITLLEDIGRGVQVHEVDDALVLRSIDWLRHRVAHDPASM
jgi:3-dehydroquinate synthase